MKNVILSTDDLQLGYKKKGKDLLLGTPLSVKVEEGSCVAVFGANGVGKSTLIRTLSGIQAPLYGAIEILGQPLISYKKNALARILSVVLTQPSGSSNLLIHELLAMGRHPWVPAFTKLSKTDREIINRQVERLQLQKLLFRRCFELSDGQMQRVHLARALIQDTPLILLDEPTTHLDLHHKAYLLKMLQQISKEDKKTVFFTTHEINWVLPICDKILLLRPDGFDYGTPAELAQNDRFKGVFLNQHLKFKDLNQGFILD